MSRRVRRRAIASLALVVIALSVAGSLRTAVVTGESMLPTYQPGQVVLVNRWYRLTGPLRKGDVILIRKGHDILIKRVAYLPGDLVDTRSMYSFWSVAQYFDRVPGGGPKPWYQLKVPAGFVVVLGDNRAISDDSRAFGPVPLRDVLGRVLNAPPKP